MDQSLAAWVQDGILIGIFIISAIGGLIVWEIKKVHSRIDKYHDEHVKRVEAIEKELKDHLKEGVEIYKALTAIQTELKHIRREYNEG